MWKITVGIIFCLVLGTIVVPTNAVADSNLSDFGKDYKNYQANEFCYYFKVNASDVVNFTWKNGTGAWYIAMRSPLGFIEYNNVDSSGNHVWGDSDSPPVSCVVKVAGEEIITIAVRTYSLFNLTFNVTRTTDSNGTQAKVERLEAELVSVKNETAKLNATIWDLNARLANATALLNLSIENISKLNSSLQDNLTRLNASLQENLTKLKIYLLENLTNLNSSVQDDLNGLDESLRDNITNLRADTWAELINLTVDESTDVSAVRAKISELNASLTLTIDELRAMGMTNDSALLRQLLDMLAYMELMNETLNNQIIPPAYNDTSLWNAIDNLTDNVTNVTVEYNTTVINQTIVNQTYVNGTGENQTDYNQTNGSSSEGARIAPDVVYGTVFGGIISGVVSGVATSVVLRRRIKYTP